MRRAARVDANQLEIIKVLRSIGASVQPLHTVGEGCPDVLIGYHGMNGLMEIKNGDKPPSSQALTPQEKRWHENWRGDVMIVNSIPDALAYAKRLWQSV